MKILVIEDEIGKQKEIVEFLKSEIDEYDIKIANSLMSAMLLVRKSIYDIIILDMSLPLYDLNGENEEVNEFEAFGGIEILEEISRKKLPVKAIVITAFDVIEDDSRKLSLEQLDSQMKENYEEYYLGGIHYDQSSLEWKTELREFLR